MPTLLYPIVPEGYVVPILVGLKASTIVQLAAMGIAIPAPIQGLGVIDSGSNVTSVSASLLRRLLISATSTSTTTTAAGTIPVILYEISLSISPLGGAPSPLFTHPHLLVMEWQQPDPPIEILIGRDVLLHCKTIIDGPAASFSIEF